MITRFNEIHNNWKNVKNKCRTTVGKKYSEVEATDKFKQDMMICEHSPIRLITVDWTWEDIEYWLSTEWSRHKFEKFITSNRDDRTITGDRCSDSQCKPVNYDGYANAQNLIDSWRKRLCGCADPKARMLAIDFKLALYEYIPELANVLVPNCVYRGGCPEIPGMTKCSFWDSFVSRHAQVDMHDIRERYKAYNEEMAMMLNDCEEGVK